ncbi:hypothetical protein IQ215_05455 [Cyanobacterium stanieri LEGE 03274]|uniref:Uncharacterized protein n=1 Tax=Cyanobacterium stanieri LEGE 03274 TaxID=1828756 RepID=A0ABR9V2L3_9CHRO|nr:hypothetical protein [Cyanobacterium stanieri]MBE9222138.1 hypothetical protein [Cyanobacterium stanieri LEGE 03274]
MGINNFSGNNKNEPKDNISSSQENDIKKQLEQLEQEISPQKSNKLPPSKQSNFVSNIKSTIKRIFFITLGISIPAGFLYIVNLPYAAIRRPVNRHAPVLLLPSQIIVENNFKKALNLTEQAEQLIDNATDFPDLDLGSQRLQEGKVYLDKIPIIAQNELMGYGNSNRVYRSGFSGTKFVEMRKKVGELEAKIFQGTNAKQTLNKLENQLADLKSQYQNSNSDTEKRQIIQQWRTMLNEFNLISSSTFAGTIAQQKLVVHELDFEDVVGFSANNERLATFIGTAEDFARLAKTRSQNPPYTVSEWSDIEDFWEKAINELEKIPETDLEGYRQANRIIVGYEDSLRDARLRKEIEEDSLRSLENAENLISRYRNSNANLDDSPNNISRRIVQIQDIISILNSVDPNSTSYPTAQKLIGDAQNQINDLKSRL